MSPRSPPWRVGSRESSPRELCPAAAAPGARPVAVVVVAARQAPRWPLGHADERRPTRRGRGRTPLGRAPPGHAPQRLPRRLDHRRRGAPHRRGAQRNAQRRDLHRAGRGHLGQHAGGRLRAGEPHRRRQADRDRVRAGPHLGPHRARRVRRAGAHPGSHHDRLRRAGAGAARAASGHARGRHGDRHGDRNGGQPAAARPGQEQSARAAHRPRQQQGHCGSPNRRGGGGDVRGAGSVMTFDAPGVLALAPLIGGAVWFAAAWARRVRIRRAALWSQETVRQAVAAGRLGPTALAVAAFLGVVALAGPRWGEERIVAETRGLSVVLAVDISRSMLAEDATPSRLRRAVREARRLVQDLDGDRIGLIAFAGSSYIMSPLSIDGSALTLYLDALDPDMASQGGTGLAPALRQGGELLQASSELADRVLVVFTDGEAHDSLPPITAQAERLKADGIRLILVAEGGRNPSRIPVRDDHGVLLGYQKDEDGRVIETTRRDDMLGAAADAAQGTLVAADLPDQAGAVRDLVASYRRAPAGETSAQPRPPRGVAR